MTHQTAHTSRKWQWKTQERIEWNQKFKWRVEKRKSKAERNSWMNQLCIITFISKKNQSKWPQKQQTQETGEVSKKNLIDSDSDILSENFWEYWSDYSSSFVSFQFHCDSLQCSWNFVTMFFLFSSFYLLRYHYVNSAKTTHWSVSIREAMEQGDQKAWDWKSQSQKRNSFKGSFNQKEKHSDWKSQEWIEQERSFISRKTFRKKAEKTCQASFQTFDLKSWSSQKIDGILIFWLNDCSSFRNFKKKCCKIHQETFSQIVNFLSPKKSKWNSSSFCFCSDLCSIAVKKFCTIKSKFLRKIWASNSSRFYFESLLLWLF